MMRSVCDNERKNKREKNHILKHTSDWSNNNTNNIHHMIGQLHHLHASRKNKTQNQMQNS